MSFTLKSGSELGGAGVRGCRASLSPGRWAPWSGPGGGAGRDAAPAVAPGRTVAPAAPARPGYARTPSATSPAASPPLPPSPRGCGTVCPGLPEYLAPPLPNPAASAPSAAAALPPLPTSTPVSPARPGRSGRSPAPRPPRTAVAGAPRYLPPPPPSLRRDGTAAAGAALKGCAFPLPGGGYGNGPAPARPGRPLSVRDGLGSWPGPPCLLPFRITPAVFLQGCIFGPTLCQGSSRLLASISRWQEIPRNAAGDGRRSAGWEQRREGVGGDLGPGEFGRVGCG